jgi:hypothetical protein
MSVCCLWRIKYECPIYGKWSHPPCSNSLWAGLIEVIFGISCWGTIVLPYPFKPFTYIFVACSRHKYTWNTVLLIFSITQSLNHFLSLYTTIWYNFKTVVNHFLSLYTTIWYHFKTVVNRFLSLYTTIWYDFKTVVNHFLSLYTTIWYDFKTVVNHFLSLYTTFWYDFKTGVNHFLSLYTTFWNDFKTGQLFSISVHYILKWF